MKARTVLFTLAFLGLLCAATSSLAAVVYRPHVVVVRGGPYTHGWYGPRVINVTGPFGEIDFDIKPNKSDVYVDGVHIGIADSFDGWPQTFRVRAGKHIIRIVSPDGRVHRDTIYVQAGKETNVKVKF
ncbi:MAG: PEGA domain-containing protein [Acidobacteria bacterium]|nr:PEGA domain-containing protein [Acidobacteriota bacterium]